MSHKTHLCFLFPMRKRLQDPHVYDGTEKSCFEIFFKPLKVTSAIKHRKTAEEIIIYTHRVYSLLLKLERNKV